MFAITLDEAGADVGVVTFERNYKLFQSDSVRGHALRIGRYLILFGEATDRVDLGNASNVSQLRLDDPVLDFTQVGRRVGLTIRTARLGLGLDRPEEDFPRPVEMGPRVTSTPCGSSLLAACSRSLTNCRAK